MMHRASRERSAAILLIVTSVVWLHQWFPALLVAAFVLWILLHKRLEGDLGTGLLRLWWRLWPPRTFVLVPLLLAGALLYWVANVPITAKVMPVTLNLLALSVLLFGNWWRIFRRVEMSWTRRELASSLPPRLSTSPTDGRALHRRAEESHG